MSVIIFGRGRADLLIASIGTATKRSGQIIAETSLSNQIRGHIGMVGVDSRIENCHCHSATRHPKRLNMGRAHEGRALGEGCVRNSIDVDRYHFGVAHQCLDRLSIRPTTKAADPPVLMSN